MSDDRLAAAYSLAGSNPSDFVSHVPRLYDLVIELSARTVIELGVRYGVSTVALLWGLAQTNGDLYSVDLDLAPAAFPRDAVAGDQRVRWHQVTGGSTDGRVLRQLPQRADIVFVDTDHRYASTTNEIALYTARIANGGALVFHDTAVETFPEHGGAEPPFPVRRAVDEFLASTTIPIAEHVRHEDCYGLDVVRFL